MHTTRMMEVSQRLRTQDNRATADPIFCVQILVRDVGYDWAYTDHHCWVDSANGETICDDDPNFKEPTGVEWEKFGYTDRWETVKVALTERGCLNYLGVDGHNVKQRAFRGRFRIHVESMSRCQEMIDIREYLMHLPAINSMRKTPGEIAYEAYCRARDYKSINGDPLPHYQQQREEIRAAWECAGEAVAAAVKADAGLNAGPG